MQQRFWSAQSFNFGAFFFGYYGFVGVYAPYVSLYFAGIGMTAVQIGILMSLGQAMRILGPNLWGWVADATQQRVRVMRFTAIGAFVSFLGIFFGESFVYLFLMMTALNLFTSAQGPLCDALMIGEMRGDLSRYGIIRLWGSVGYIVVVMSAGWLFDRAGIGMMPWVGLAMLGFVLFVSTRLQETQPRIAPQEKPAMRVLLRRREIIAFLVSAFMMIASHMALYVFFSLYMVQLGYSNVVIGLMWTLGVLAEIAFFFYQAPLFRKIGVQRLMLLSLAVAVVRFFLIGVGAESLIFILIAQIMHGITFGVHHSSCVMLLQRWFSGPLQARGQALYVSVSYGLGGTLGGIAFSAIWTRFGPEAVYLSAAFLALIGLIAAALSFRWHPVQAAER